MAKKKNEQTMVKDKLLTMRLSSELYSDLKIIGSGMVGKGARQVFDHYRSEIKKAAKKYSKS